jgi:hypothetical protein
LKTHLSLELLAASLKMAPEFIKGVGYFSLFGKSNQAHAATSFGGF